MINEIGKEEENKSEFLTFKVRLPGILVYIYYYFFFFVIFCVIIILNYVFFFFPL